MYHKMHCFLFSSHLLSSPFFLALAYEIVVVNITNIRGNIRSRLFYPPSLRTVRALHFDCEKTLFSPFLFSPRRFDRAE